MDEHHSSPIDDPNTNFKNRLFKNTLFVIISVPLLFMGSKYLPQAIPQRDTSTTHMSNVSSSVQMRLTMTTGSIPYASSESMIVKVIMNQSYILKSIVHHPFRRDAIDVFNDISIPIPLDEIKTLTLEVNGHDAWRLKSLSLQFSKDNKRSPEYLYQTDQWFSSDPKDLKKTDRTGCVVSKTYQLKPVTL